MRRLTVCVSLCVLFVSSVIVVDCRSWADNPRPAAARSNSANPLDRGQFISGPLPATPTTRSSAAAAPVTAQPAVPTSQSAASVPQAPTAQGGSGMVTGIGPVASSQIQPPPFVRILTPEMAASFEPQAVIEVGTPADSAAEGKINAALSMPAEIDFHETPLSEAIQHLKKRYKIEIQLDNPALKEAGIDAGTTVTRQTSGISLRSALRLLLDDLQLKYVVHNEVLLITSPTKAESDDFMSTRLYPVKDLILIRNENNEIETDFQPLIDLITNTIQTKTWVDNGGTGTIGPYQFQDRCMLVISQTQQVHEDIVNLLAAVRRVAPSDAKPGSELRLPKRPRDKGARGFQPGGVGGGLF